MRVVLDNDTTTRDKFPLNGLCMTKGGYGGVSMILKTGMEVSQDYIVFNYGPPRPHKFTNYQYISTVAGPGFKPSLKFVLPGNIK